MRMCLCEWDNWRWEGPRTNYWVDCLTPVTGGIYSVFVCASVGVCKGGLYQQLEWAVGFKGFYVQASYQRDPYCIHTYMFSCNGPSSWSASERNKIRPLVLFAWVFLSVLICVAGHAYMYIFVVYMHVPAYWEYTPTSWTCWRGGAAALPLSDFWIQQLRSLFNITWRGSELHCWVPGADNSIKSYFRQNIIIIWAVTIKPQTIVMKLKGNMYIFL